MQHFYFRARNVSDEKSPNTEVAAATPISTIHVFDYQNQSEKLK